MAVVATITISSVDYYVYGLTADAVGDADDYMAARLGSTAWTSATTLQKQQSLISAARWMDRVLNFSGTKTSYSQPLQWPRDGADCNGEAITDGTIPDNVALAEFELALVLLGDNSAQDQYGQGSNIKRVGAGSASVEFFTPTIDSSRDTRLPPVPMDLLKCVLQGAGDGLSLAGGAIAYGTSSSDDCCDLTESHFDCDDQFDRSRGF